MTAVKPRIYIRRGRWWCQSPRAYLGAQGDTPLAAYLAWRELVA